VAMQVPHVTGSAAASLSAMLGPCNMHVAFNTYVTDLTHRVHFVNECSIFMNPI